MLAIKRMNLQKPLHNLKVINFQNNGSNYSIETILFAGIKQYNDEDIPKCWHATLQRLLYILLIEIYRRE